MSLYQPKGTRFWWVRFQFEGQIIRRSSKSTSRSVAEKFEAELKEELARQYRGGQPRRSFDDAAADFIQEHLPTLKPESARRYKTSLKALIDAFENLFLDEIDTERMAGFETKRRRDGLTGSGIRRDFACLSSMFGFEIDQGRREDNPVTPYLKRRAKRGLKENPPRIRYLSHAEEVALIDAAAPYLKPMVAFAIETGLRLEEHLSLEWDQIDRSRNEITILKTKSSTPRIVPLTDQAAHLLSKLPRHLHSPFVFTKPDGTRYGKLTRGLAGAAKRAGVKNLEWHDLRRTCGCRLLQDKGFTMEQVSKWLGHSSVVVTERHYAFLQTEHLHAALAKHKNGQRARG